MVGTDRAITVTRVSDSSELADGDSYQHGEELRLTLSATDSYFIWEVTTDDLNTATSSSCAFDEYAKSPHLFFSFLPHAFTVTRKYYILERLLFPVRSPSNAPLYVRLHLASFAATASRA